MEENKITEFWNPITSKWVRKLPKGFVDKIVKTREVEVSNKKNK
jgi:hypothetical protein